MRNILCLHNNNDTTMDNDNVAFEAMVVLGSAHLTLSTNKKNKEAEKGDKGNVLGGSNA